MLVADVPAEIFVRGLADSAVEVSLLFDFLTNRMIDLLHTG